MISEILDRLDEVESRLSSIEKLLSAESKPPTAEHSCRRCNDTGEINVLIPHTIADSEDIPCPDCSYSKEPEWRPMSEAPRDGTKIMGGFRDPHLPHGSITIEKPIYWRGGYTQQWFHFEGNNL